jgi:hypothetical protein
MYFTILFEENLLLLEVENEIISHAFCDNNIHLYYMGTGDLNHQTKMLLARL